MTNQPKPIRWYQVFQNGQRYMKCWPKDKRLAVVFPENRMSKATQFAIRFMPAIAVFTLSWQMILGGQLGPALAAALFACSLPMQGLWWLGRRAVTALPVSLAQWLSELRQKLSEAGESVEPLGEPVTYQDLANALQLAFKRLDHTFLDDL